MTQLLTQLTTSTPRAHLVRPLCVLFFLFIFFLGALGGYFSLCFAFWLHIRLWLHINKLTVNLQHLAIYFFCSMLACYSAMNCTDHIIPHHRTGSNSDELFTPFVLSILVSVTQGSKLSFPSLVGADLIWFRCEDNVMPPEAKRIFKILSLNPFLDLKQLQCGSIAQWLHMESPAGLQKMAHLALCLQTPLKLVFFCHPDTQMLSV